MQLGKTPLLGHRARQGVPAALPVRQTPARVVPAAGRPRAVKLAAAPRGDAPAMQQAQAPSVEKQQQQHHQQQAPHILQQWATRLAKGAAVLGLAMALLLGRSTPPALAARSAGRAGGFHAANSVFMRAKRSGGIAGGLSRTYGNSGRTMGPSPWCARAAVQPRACACMHTSPASSKQGLRTQGRRPATCTRSCA